MRCQDITNTEIAFGAFSQILRGSSLAESSVRENGFTILICGPPGTGKTTLGLFLLQEAYRAFLEADSESVGRPVILSLVESADQIDRVADSFGISFKSNPMLIEARDPEHIQPLSLKSVLASVDPPPAKRDLLLVDGVSILRKSTETRESILAFIDQIKQHRLLALLVSEDLPEEKERFLEYAVDAIIRLDLNVSSKSRHLTILKWRWHDYYVGEHTFRLLDKKHRELIRSRLINRDYQVPGVIFFPSLDCLTRSRKALDNGAKRIEEGVPSGVPGLEDLIPRRGGAFVAGDKILLLGPPGIGKNLIGMQFLEGQLPKESKWYEGEPQEAEESAGIIDRIYLSFGRAHRDMQSLLNAYGKDTCYCCCLYYDPANLILGEVMGALHNLLTLHERSKTKRVARLFVDGISALRSRFDNQATYYHFLRSFLGMLETFPNLVSMFAYEIESIFASYAEIKIPVGERFSTILGLNFQEQHNALIRGLVVLKCRGRQHDTSLSFADIKDSVFSVDPEAGWGRVGLLGGERERVREERPFIKLFFENRSEQEILEAPFKEFKDRYPEDHVFRMVPKQNPEPSHWSFLGYAGPGHSNTKIVALRKYFMNELESRKKVFMEVPLSLTERIDRYAGEKSSLWKGFEHDRKFIVPYYADVGLLVYQWDLLKQLQGDISEDPPKVPRTWDDLIELRKSFHKIRGPKTKHLFLIPNTVTDSKSFVTFFFELCWTFGWKEEPGPDTFKYLVNWVSDDSFRSALRLLKRLVKEGGELIPNPTIGGHYHESVFARRWFSKIHLRWPDVENKSGEKPLQFGIAPLPGVDPTRPGISCVDLYGLAILEDALVPETGWMLVSELIGVDVDAQRARKKRGLPIGKDIFHSDLIQSRLRAPYPWPQGSPESYQKIEYVFVDYPAVLRSILYPQNDTDRRFRRTCDIERFFQLEEVLAGVIPKLFDMREPCSDEEVTAEVLKELEARRAKGIWA